MLYFFIGDLVFEIWPSVAGEIIINNEREEKSES